MTTSEKTKIAGLKNLTWLANKFNKTTETLRAWDKENPDLFEAVIFYAVHMKKIGKWK